VNRFSDRRISQKKLFGFRIWRIVYTKLRILLIQRIADLSNILARIVDLARNLVRILVCDFILELLADSNLDKTIVGSRILLQIWADRRICIPPCPPPPPPRIVFVLAQDRQTSTLVRSGEIPVISIRGWVYSRYNKC
jgi:hypothetical protein